MGDYLEISFSRKALRTVLAVVTLLAMVGVGVLGYFHTPNPAQIIEWSDWAKWKVERRYREELAQLQKDLAELADILQSHPDPVRAELAAARIEQHHATGLGLLEGQRDVTLLAAGIVRDWAAGYESYDGAVTAVNRAIEVLENTEYHIGGGDGHDSIQKTTSTGESGNDGTEEGWWTERE